MLAILQDGLVAGRIARNSDFAELRRCQASCDLMPPASFSRSPLEKVWLARRLERPRAAGLTELTDGELYLIVAGGGGTIR
jgi:hypothetical protein